MLFEGVKTIAKISMPSTAFPKLAWYISFEGFVVLQKYVVIYNEWKVLISWLFCILKSYVVFLSFILHQ